MSIHRYGYPDYTEADMEHVQRLAEACGGEPSRRLPDLGVYSAYIFPTKVQARDFARRVKRTKKGRAWPEVRENDPTNEVVIWSVPESRR